MIYLDLMKSSEVRKAGDWCYNNADIVICWFKNWNCEFQFSQTIIKSTFNLPSNLIYILHMKQSHKLLFKYILVLTYLYVFDLEFNKYFMCIMCIRTCIYHVKLVILVLDIWKTRYPNQYPIHILVAVHINISIVGNRSLKSGAPT